MMPPRPVRPPSNPLEMPMATSAGAPIFIGFDGWAHKVVRRVEDEQHSDAEAQISRIDVGQQHHADRDADCRTQRQRPDSCQLNSWRSFAMP